MPIVQRRISGKVETPWSGYSKEAINAQYDNNV